MLYKLHIFVFIYLHYTAAAQNGRKNIKCKIKAIMKKKSCQIV